MPIEFACEECGSVLRVPDGSSGKRSRCPACKHEQEVPFVVDAQAEAAPSGKLSIPCPKCQHHLVCAPELLGTRGQCKQCAHIFTISTDPVVKDETSPALVFHCPECHQLFEGREEMRGRKGKCHVCQAVFAIKLVPAAGPATQPTQATTAQPARNPASTKASNHTRSQASDAVADRSADRSSSKATERQSTERQSTGRQSTERPGRPGESNVNEQLELVDDQPQSSRAGRKVATSDQPIRFECSHCQGVMEVPGSTAGLETECPYCQVVLTIPAASTVKVSPPPAAPRPAASTGYAAPQTAYTTPTPAYSTPAYSTPAYSTPAQPQADPLAAHDPFADLDLASASNPYAATASSTWSAPSGASRARSNALTVGNVLQQGFEALFPSCLLVFLHLIIALAAGMAMWGCVYLLGYSLRGMNISVEVAQYLGIAVAVCLMIAGVLLSAWLYSAIARMALDAVRKKPLSISDALDPGGGFGAVLLVFGGSIGISMIINLPMFINRATGGALNGMAALIVIWALLWVPVSILFAIATCLAVFAGVDDEPSSVAIQTSSSLVFQNFWTTLGVLLVSGLLTIVLVIPTLGLAYVLPIYMMASLYNLASKA